MLEGARQQKIVLASGNAGKIREIQAMLPEHPILRQAEFGIGDAEETGSTFVENAIIKARHAALHSGLPAIADDSGLVVDALNGAPGVYSARYAGPGSSDLDNLNKLLRDLAGIPDAARSARFICVLAFLRHAADPMPIIAQGVWEGRIATHPAGGNGFGYDPVFWLPAHGCTSAELAPEVKNALSHRGQALRNLAALFNTQETHLAW